MNHFEWWNFGLLVKPLDEQNQILTGDFSLLNPFEQVRVQLRRQVAAPNFGHASFAVKAPRHRRFQSHDFGRVNRVSQALSKRS